MQQGNNHGDKSEEEYLVRRMQDKIAILEAKKVNILSHNTLTLLICQLWRSGFFSALKHTADSLAPIC